MITRLHQPDDSHPPTKLDLPPATFSADTQPQYVIRTKLQVPQSRSSDREIVRSDPLGLLERAAENRVALIAAPAGYGKTSLASAWAIQTERDVAWLTLDARDNDRYRFLLYLRAALGDLPGLDGVSELNEVVQPGLELDALISAAGSLSVPSTLILDDVHAVTDRWVLDAIEYLMAFAPKSVNFILISRSEPPIVSPRLKIAGDYFVIGATDLELTAAELTELIGSVSAEPLEDEQISLVLDATEGWIAAASIVAMLGRGSTSLNDPATWIRRSPAGRVISDYLIDEVLSGLQQERLDCLKRIAICDRVNGPLCECLTGVPNGHDELAAIERAGLFLTPVGMDGEWFSLHPIFRGVLRGELVRQMTTVDIQRLHANASAWFEDAGYLEEAIHHAVEAEAWERVTELLKTALPKLNSESRYEYMLSLLNKVPRKVIDASPQVSVQLAIAHSASRDTRPVAELVRRYRELWSQDADPVVQGYGAIIESRLALDRGDWRGAIEHAQRAIEAAAETDLLTTMRARYQISRAMWMAGKPHRTLRFVEEMLRDVESSDQEIVPYGSLQLKLTIARLQVETGQVREGVAALELLCEQYEELHPRAHVVASIWLAQVAYSRNDLQRCHAWLERVAQTNFNGELARFEPRWHLMRARLLAATGDQAGAREAYEEGIAVAELRKDIRWRREIRAAYTTFGLDLEDPKVIAGWIDTTSRPSVLSSDVVDVKESLTFARIFISLDKYLDALDVLVPVTAHAQADGRAWDEVDGLLLSAYAHDQLGDAETARLEVVKAVALARPGGFVRPFLDTGSNVSTFVVESLREEDTNPFIERILLPGSQPDPSLGTFVDATGPLTPRETQILRLISLGLTNQAIAERADIAVSTVKRHVSNILIKLGASNRTEALHLAGQLGVLGSERL